MKHERHIKADVEEIAAALETAAILVGVSDIYIPIFERLDKEHKRAMAAKAVNPILNARAVIAARQQDGPKLRVAG